MNRQISIILGEELERAIDYARYTRKERRLQDTIRKLLLSHPEVREAAKHEGIDLDQEDVQRGGNRRSKKKTDTATEP